MLPSSIESESEAEEQERIRPKAEMTSAEVANRSQQCAALLRETVSNTVPGTVNVRKGRAAQTPSISSEEGEAGILEGMVDQLPQVPYTPNTGSQMVWSIEPICQVSTPVVRGNVPQNGDVLCGRESVKLVEAWVFHPVPRAVPNPRKSQSAVKHNMTEAVEHSLQVAVQEFKKKILKLKCVCLANATLIFNSWIQSIDKCVRDHNLTEHKAEHLVKDTLQNMPMELSSFTLTWMTNGGMLHLLSI